MQQAVAFRDAGHWDRAVTALQGAIKVGSYNEDVHYTLGSWMEIYSMPKDMITYWAEEAKTDPKPQTAYYYWAVGMDRSGDEAGALAKLSQGLDIDPAHEMSELYTARILEREGKHAKALEHCFTSTQILPTFRRGHEFCAQILLAMGRKADADRESALALSSDAKPPRTFYYWARWLTGKGRITAAKAEIQRALAQDPNDAEAWALLRKINALGADAAP